jgi:LmeA-like phospholipid-binding
MRALRRILIVLVILGVLLVVVDRVGAWVAQRVVADQVEAELASSQVSSSPPEVTVNGVPFLTQVIAGRYDSVTLRLRDVGTSELTLPVVELTATGVTAPAGTLIDREGPITAEQVDGTATIGYASVASFTDVEGLELSAADGGLLAVRVPTEVANTPVVLVGTAEMEVVEGGVRLSVDQLEVEEPPLPPGAEPLVEDLIQRMAVTVELPPLPYGLTLEGVRAEPDGLAVSVSAVDVPLAR